ncbi:MAG: NUDIX hydrolase [Thermoplasmata archaeon]
MKAWEKDLKDRLLSGYAEPPADTPSAAVALILREWQDEFQVLLIERIEREGDPWSGQIALPGGMKDSGDRSISDTAKREVMEEVSLDLDKACVALGIMSEVRPANKPRLVVFPLVYSLQKDVPLKEGREVREVFWASLSSIKESRTTGTVEVQGRELLVPTFLHGDRLIWGLTYRILSAFFELCPGLTGRPG